ncbi:hypothetical protein EV127DRAFT_84730 [Xylaria flabelliformis]|nr:hypothetical protein EV127DRAFT_84730 [Xylaria flabelliformis]
MHAFFVVLTSLLASLGATTPVLSTADAPTNLTKVWTLDEVSRKSHHKGRICKWEFTLTESMSPPSYDDSDMVIRCDFELRVLKGHDCRVGNFGLTQCSRRNPDFYVSGGHDKTGFLTLVVSNTFENAQAYFGYLDSVLDARGMIPPQTSPVKTQNKTT